MTRISASRIFDLNIVITLLSRKHFEVTYQLVRFILILSSLGIFTSISESIFLFERKMITSRKDKRYRFFIDLGLNPRSTEAIFSKFIILPLQYTLLKQPHG